MNMNPLLILTLLKGHKVHSHSHSELRKPLHKNVRLRDTDEYHSGV